MRRCVLVGSTGIGAVSAVLLSQPTSLWNKKLNKNCFLVPRYSCVLAESDTVEDDIGSNEEKSDPSVLRVPVAVIGAGWAGLGVAAGLSRLDIPYVLLEQGDKPGYFWDHMVYDSVRMNTFRHRLWKSPKECEPKSKEECRYMHKDEVLKYLDCYSDHYSVKPNLRLHSQVTSIAPLPPSNDDDISNPNIEGSKPQWKVKVQKRQVINNDDDKGEIIPLDSDSFEVICDYLCVATSSTRKPVIPQVFQSLHQRSNVNSSKHSTLVLHSSEFKSPDQIARLLREKNGNFGHSGINGDSSSLYKILVIGCGNSAFEISGELYHFIDPYLQHRRPFGNDCISINIRNGSHGRHVLKQQNKERFERFFHYAARPSPFSDESLLNDNIESMNDPIKMHKEIIEFDSLSERVLCDSQIHTKGNIPKPKISPTADHYYNRKLAIVDQKQASHLIKTGRINVKHGDIAKVSVVSTVIDNNGEPTEIERVKVEFEDEQKNVNSEQVFDLVILCTGFSHGLEDLFEDRDLWEHQLSTDQVQYPMGLQNALNNDETWMNLPLKTPFRWPKTNRLCRSKYFNNLYFPAFDSGYLGGLTIGLYSMSIAEDIARQRNNDPDFQPETFPLSVLEQTQ